MSIQALREQRAAKASAVRELVEKADWNAERDQPVYDAAIAEIEAIDGHIERHNTLNRIAAEQATTEQVIITAERVAQDKRDPASAMFARLLRGGDRALTNEEWGDYRNTMSTTTDSEGGYTVPDLLGGQIIDSLKAFGGMREEATVIRTADGAPLNYPTSDGTSEVGEILAENATAADADTTFGTVAVPVYKYSSKVITVPIELLQDSAFDLEGFLRGRIVTRLGRITNTHFTTGSGSSQPNGVVTAASTGVTAATGGATTFTYANLVDLVHSVDPAYRLNDPCFMMSDSAVKVAKKIVDGQSRPIFLPAYDLSNNGSVDRILGQRVCLNQSVAVPAANAKSIVFGDLSKYIIRDAMALSMMRFTDSAYAKKGQVGFLAMLRTGGNLTDTGAVKLFVHSAS